MTPDFNPPSFPAHGPVTAALPSGFLWLAFGASLQRYLRDAGTARIVNTVMAAGLAASVAMILW